MKNKVFDRDIDEFKEKLELLMKEFNVCIEADEDIPDSVCVYDKDNHQCFWIESDDSQESSENTIRLPKSKEEAKSMLLVAEAYLKQSEANNMEKVAEGYYRFKESHHVSEGVSVHMTVDKIDGEDLDTVVSIRGELAVCGSERQQFNDELTALIEKYRI